MKIVNIDSFDIQHFHFQAGGFIPNGGIVKVDMTDVCEFFSRCGEIDGKFVVLTYNGDYGITDQKKHTIRNDFLKHIMFNYMYFADIISETNGLEPLVAMPQCHVGQCSLRDSHVIKNDSFSHQTFNLDIPKNVYQWFSVNCDLDFPKITNLPFGVNHVEPDGPFSGSIEDNGWKHIPKQDKLYISYSNHTLQRKKIKEMFREHDWVTIIDKEANKAGIPHDLYMKLMAEHKFVLCPSGVGYDCFRTWEALYTGSIPVVEWRKWSAWMEELPIIFVDKFSSVTLDSLKQAADNMKDMNFKPALMSEEYWQDRINRTWEEANA